MTPPARSTPFIETFPTRRIPGHAALVWISCRIYAAFFGASLTGVRDDAAQYLAAISGRGVEP